jgi:hypothetical protein
MRAEGWNGGARRDDRCLVTADKHVTTATNEHATIAEPLKRRFYVVHAEAM